MKNQMVYAMLFAAGIFGFSSCNNPELENRIEKLEERVVLLETQASSINAFNGSREMVGNISNSGMQAANTNASNVVNPSPEKLADVTETKGPVGKFQFEQEEYNFGNIKEGAVIEHTFKFKNVGETPLVIQSASASCGCTVPSYSKEPIPVGGSGEIQIKFNSSGKSGAQNSAVTITANTAKPTTTLRVKGNVEGKGQDLSAGPVRN